ncbi:MAG: response regulator [Cyclobacteriaceae bacterium]
MDKKPFILYVDDDPDDRELFGYALTTCGADYDLITADDGFDALKILASGEKPKCLYIDINMPVMSGLELLKIIKSNSLYALLPVFIFTTAANEESIEEAKRLGAADVIIKPRSIQGLINYLHSCFSTTVMRNEFL